MIRPKKQSCMVRVHFYLPERLLMDLHRYSARDEFRLSQSARRLLAEGLARAKKESA